MLVPCLGSRLNGRDPNMYEVVEKSRVKQSVNIRACRVARDLVLQRLNGRVVLLLERVCGACGCDV